MKQVTRLLPLIFLSGLAIAEPKQEWRQFRGSDGTGVLAFSELPTQLDVEQHVVWKSPLPGRGLSSPVIIGDRVFVSCASGANKDRLHVRCHSSSTGEVLWERQFWATGRTNCHDKTSVAASTPASDGQNLYVLFSSNDVFCLDLDGNLQWLRGLTSDYPNASNSLGMASSPIVVAETLIVQCENDSDSFAVGLDVESGKNRWRLERPTMSNYTTPLVLDDAASGKSLVALQSGRGISAIDPATGVTAWTYQDGASTIPSSVVADNTLYVPSHGITAIRGGSRGEEAEQLWRSGQLRPATASPIVVGDKIFTVNNAGVVTAGRLTDGKRLWQLRTKGPYSGSPVGWGHYLYFANEKGLVQVVDVSADEGAIVSQIDLQETFLCTPAIADGALYLRSDQHLWKIGKKG